MAKIMVVDDEKAIVYLIKVLMEREGFEVMEAYAAGAWDTRLPQINGIWYKDAKGGVHSTPPRGQMPNLNSLPNMSRALLVGTSSTSRLKASSALAVE